MQMSSATYASLDPTNLDNFKNPLHLPGDDGLMGVLDASDAPVRFTAQKESVEILPGKRAYLLAYHAERHGKTYVNPTFKVRKGKEFSAEFANNLDEETTVHWHGLHVDWRMDGHPFQPVAPGSHLPLLLPGARSGQYLLVPSSPPRENSHPDLFGLVRSLPRGGRGRTEAY